MVGFGLFFGKFERIANSKSELVSELCYTGQDCFKTICIVARPWPKLQFVTISGQRNKKINILLVVGTRPEALNMERGGTIADPEGNSSISEVSQEDRFDESETVDQGAIIKYVLNYFAW